MTQWVESPTGGRERGPGALARAWVEVLVRPRRFFETGVAPGDQAAGLIFAAAVVLLEEGSRVGVARLAAAGHADTGHVGYPVVGGLGPLESLLVVLIAVVFVTPVVLHLVGALQTLLLVPVASDRGGVSETVQVLGYATAPCVLAGLPVPELRIACALWGATLYAVGIGVVHDLSPVRAGVLGLVPAAIAFGYGFRGFAAVATLARNGPIPL